MPWETTLNNFEEGLYLCLSKSLQCTEIKLIYFNEVHNDLSVQALGDCTNLGNWSFN